MIAPIVGQYAVLEDSAQVFMARILGIDGTPITVDTIASISYTAWDLNVSRTTASTTTTTLATSDVLYNTLQTGAPWSVDETGFNFEHQVPFNVFSLASPEHRVEYDFEPASSSNLKFKVVFKGSVHEVYMA